MRSVVKFVSYPGLYVWLLVAVVLVAVWVGAAGLATSQQVLPKRTSLSEATVAMDSLVGHSQWAMASGHDAATVASWASTTSQMADQAAAAWSGLGTAKGAQVSAALVAAADAADRLAASAQEGPPAIDARRADTLTAIYAAAEAAGPGFVRVPTPAAPAPPASPSTAAPTPVPDLPTPAPVPTPQVRR